MAGEPSPFGKLLLHYRHARGWSQAQLADESGVSLSVIKWTETGRTRVPEPDNVAALAKAFGLRGAGLKEFKDAARRSDPEARMSAIEDRQEQQERLLREILARLPEPPPEGDGAPRREGRR